MDRVLRRLADGRSRDLTFNLGGYTHEEENYLRSTYRRNRSKIDMSWKKDLNRAVANIKPSDITIPNFTIPDAYFKNIKIGG